MENKESEEKKAKEAGPKAKTTRSKKNVEDKLDDLADRFSKAMTDGVKQMEEAFDKGIKNLKESPNITSGKVKGFFRTTTGATVLIIFGIVWFFYAVGWLAKPIFPILLIVLGVYVLLKSKSDE